jgi:TetR/AcrR family transcriptional regulator, cholesterol catabolism regulator
LSDLTKILSISRTLFERYGVKSISMDDIAKELSISKKTLYQHVAGKNELINTIILHYLKEEESVISKIKQESENAIQEMRSIARYVLDFIGQLNPKLIYDLRKFHSGSWNLIEGDHMEYIKKTIQDNIIRGKTEGLYREELNEDIISGLYITYSKNFIMNLSLDQGYSPKELYREMVLYHLHGIMSDAGNQLFKQKTV